MLQPDENISISFFIFPSKQQGPASGGTFCYGEWSKVNGEFASAFSNNRSIAIILREH
jgi:hypothetical protein